MFNNYIFNQAPSSSSSHHPHYASYFSHPGTSSAAANNKPPSDLSIFSSTGSATNPLPPPPTSSRWYKSTSMIDPSPASSSTQPYSLDPLALHHHNVASTSQLLNLALTNRFTTSSMATTSYSTSKSASPKTDTQSAVAAADLALIAKSKEVVRKWILDTAK